MRFLKHKKRMNTSFLNNKNLTRGIRNNNPGNLIKSKENWQGKIPHSQNTDSRFEQFYRLVDGLRAMMIQLRSDILKGKNTLTKLIHKYAPIYENDTTMYINSVAKSIDLEADQPITFLDMSLLIKITKAMVKVENGGDALLIKDKDYANAYSILNRDMPVKVSSFNVEQVKDVVKKKR